MDFSVFANKAMLKSQYNQFSQYSGNLDTVPKMLRALYQDYNPICVEIEFNNGDVRFYPVEELPDLQKEYCYLNAEFVFATCNSDPIFFHDGQIFTCPHGVREPKWEALDIKSLFLQDAGEQNKSPAKKEK